MQHFSYLTALALIMKSAMSSTVYPDRIAVWGGGGNLVPLYVNLNNFLLANARHCERLIILPHTIYGYENTLAQLGPNCDIFCRDQMSLAFVRQHAPHANIRLSHDIAFSVNFDQTMQEARTIPYPLPLGQGIRAPQRETVALLRPV